MAAAAAVHRASFDERLPWLAGLHTPAEDSAHFSEHICETCQVWGAINATQVVGIIAFRQGWIDQLYVLPRFQNRGFGTAPLDIAKAQQQILRLWTFQRNVGARQFYERRGFVAVEETDGSRNEEGEPDILYEWRAR
jgi:putative acetyltransferase